MSDLSIPLKMPEAQNLAVLIRRRLTQRGDRVAMRAKTHGNWREITRQQLDELVQAAAKALLAMGLAEQEMISIFSQNKPECTIVDVAALNIRGVPVYIYPTSTARQAAYIVNDSESRLIFVGSQEQYQKVCSFIADTPTLRKVIALDRQVRFEEYPESMYFDDFIDMGRREATDGEIDTRLSRASADDLMTLVYTSGTTGEPKGVMLTHRNMIFSAASHDIRLLDPNEEDVSLCFLPLSHIFERAWTYYVLYKGMTNNYLEDPKQIIEFIQEVKPTIMCSVPRFYEKIYATVLHRLESASAAKRRLFNWAIRAGASYHSLRKEQLPMPAMMRWKFGVAEKLVLKKIREIVGGRIKFFPCAGAPLSQEIEEFFYASGMFICYGYGLSETTATVTCHEPYHFKFGLVGKPMPGVQVKIGPMNEILVKGGTVMKGYYHKPEETARVFDDDGWFRTGDAGEFDLNGELRISDRIKDLMKTSGGKYIAPQLIETVIGSDHFIEQITVVADGRKYVSALIVPCFDVLEIYAKEHNIPFDSHEELVGNPAIIDLYGKRIEARSKELAHFEKIVHFKLLAREFSIEQGEITPTQKIKRKFVRENYKDIIDEMYTEL
jgi:long-chain acyl-CoA synthetase